MWFIASLNKIHFKKKNKREEEIHRLVEFNNCTISPFSHFKEVSLVILYLYCTYINEHSHIMKIFFFIYYLLIKLKEKSFDFRLTIVFFLFYLFWKEVKKKLKKVKIERKRGRGILSRLLSFIYIYYYIIYICLLNDGGGEFLKKVKKNHHRGLAF